MAYVPQFAHDIFICFPMEVREWAKQFRHDLTDETLLSGATGLDVALSPFESGQSSDSMLEAARNSALFVAIITADSFAEIVTEDSFGETRVRFLQREMEAFRESGPLEGRFCAITLYPGMGAKITKAMPTESPDAFWHEQEFFFEGRRRLRLGVGHDDEYRAKIEIAAIQIRSRLDELKAKQTAKKGAPDYAGKKVLLSAKRAAIEADWNRIFRVLKNDDVVVLPANDIPSESPAYEKAFNDAIKDADLFVQIFSALDVTLAKAQNAAVAAHRSIPILKWRKLGGDKAFDAAHLASLSDQDRQFCEEARTELITTFAIEVRDKLAALSKRTPELIGTDKLWLYIAFDKPDQGFARALQAAARKIAIAEAMPQNETREAHFVQGLERAGGVVFLYGDPECREFIEFWLSKYIRMEKKPPLVALYEAPPQKTEEQEPMSPIELFTVGSKDQFTLTGIDDIYAKLGGKT
jgi:hypothetical protein